MLSFVKQYLLILQVLVYCDLHGHSRKHNVFMYGCNRRDENEDAIEAILKERLFPWMMAQKVFQFLITLKQNKTSLNCLYRLGEVMFLRLE